MAIDYFIGWDQRDLEEALREAQEDLLAGRQTIQAGAGDANIQSRVEKTIEDRIRMILIKLNKLEPGKYPIENITPITQTRIAFS